MAEEGPTEDELAKAKTYLKGSFALGLDTSSKIAAQLVQMQIDNLGIDYIERRAGADRRGHARRRRAAWPSACSTAACWSPSSAARRA